MKKILIYPNGSRYFVSDGFSLRPIVEPESEIDVSEATNEEWLKIKQNPKNDKLIKPIETKTRKIKEANNLG